MNNLSMLAASSNRSSRLVKGDIVAGAAAEGHGVLLGFNGRGSLTHKIVIEIVVGAGFPEEWAPSLVSAHRHAGRAVSILNQNGYVVRADRTKSQKRDTKKSAEDIAIETALANEAAKGDAGAASVLRDRNLEGELPTWQGRWYVMSTTRATTIGQAAGEIVMIATLEENGALRIQCSNDDLAQRVRTDFETRMEREEHAAADISEWLKRTLVTRFRAAKLGGNWYVRRQHAATAEALLAAFSKRWGENFLLPALPIATSDQLLAGLTTSFEREVADVLAEYHMLAADASEEGKEISSKVSLRILGNLRELTERCLGYAALLGADRMSGLQSQIVAAATEIESTVAGISQRFADFFGK